MTLLNKIKKFIKRDKDVTNLYHPNFEGQIEKATKSDGEHLKVKGINYYRFGKETSIPWGRYMYMQTFLHEQNLRLDVSILKKYMENLTKVLNGNKGVIELGKAFQIVSQVQSRCELAFEVETTYRLASILYFDDTEDLYTYDKVYNDRKIASWKEAKTVDFFYMMPMSGFLNLSDSSPADLLTFMDQQKEIIEGLTLEMQER